MKKLLLALCLLAGAQAQNLATEARLLRFPAVNQTDITFTYAGDLYTVPRKGGVARRLTSHIGFEMFARYSPDGQQLAFTGQYDGNSEVYLMPATGGEPKRLTYTATLDRDDVSDRMGPATITMAWTPDGKNVVYRSRRQTSNDFKGQLFAAPTDGSMGSELPFSVGGWCSYEAGGQRMAYNRLFREFRTWKYYEGGMADDIWIYDYKTEKSVNITNNKAQDIMPMWYGSKIYYISDRDRTMNLFCYDVNTQQTTKVTNFTEYDIKFPSMGPDAIAFENGGYVYVFDLKTEKYEKVSVQILEDFASGRNPIIDAGKFVADFDLSHDGKRALFVARGDIWTVPAKTGVNYNLTTGTSGSHERNARWSPKGNYIAYISDASGEFEIWTMKPDGSDKKQLTKGSTSYIWHMDWSPDETKIAFSDKALTLKYVDIATGKVTQADKAEAWEFSDFAWSPDSRWLAYTRPEWQSNSRIMVHEVATGKNYPVTNGWYNSDNPSWSPDGKYLYFAAQTSFNPSYSWTEWNHSYSDMTKLYMVALKKDTPNPFADKNDLVEAAKTEAGDAKKEEKKEEKPAGGITITIDFEGLQQRIIELPTANGSYYALQAVEGKLYYAYSSQSSGGMALKVYDLNTKTETELGRPQNLAYGYGLKNLMLQENGNYYIIDLPSGKYTVDKPLALTGMRVQVDLDAEYKQVYNESWRQMRDFFYDPGMHGVDWAAMQKKYAVLVPYANHRKDLTYLIGELIGELNVGHAYVGGGDQPSVPRVKMGLLGAKLSQQNGFVRIDDIVEGSSWNSMYRSPLAEMGVNAKKGEYIVAINGQPLNTLTNPMAPLLGKADVYVELSLNSEPKLEGARKVMVKPLADESDLRYYNWVQGNIRYVEQKTNGQIGYLHIPEMGATGLTEFVKHFYPQLNKKGLIIDDRGNGGGNVSPMIIERLRRELDMVTFSRNTRPSSSPEAMVIGPKVLLFDRYSASDGDLFPYRFKFHKLGTTIGQRSWGGTVGIRGSLPFVDGGNMTRPEFSRYDVTGKEWIIEGYGVDPDIEVVNDPHEEYKGRDAQLDKAIEVILEQAQKQPTEVAPLPAKFPDKSKKQ